jgi:hypothetical protein
MKTCTNPQKHFWEIYRSRDLTPCKLDEEEYENEEEDEEEEEMMIRNTTTQITNR